MNKPPVIYTAPESRDIRQYARDVCHRLADLRGDEAYRQPEVISGLADCLDFLASLVVKYLNQGHHELLDKDQA